MAFSLMESRRRILLNTPHIEAASGDIAVFSTDMAAPLKSCIVTINPVQEGTGDPSPENVRPISGWNAVDAWRTGKNLLPASLPSNVIAGTFSASSVKIASAANARIFAIPIPKNTTIHVQKSLSDILGGGIALGDTGDIAVGTPIYNGNGFTNLQDVTYQTTGEHGWLYISTPSQANAEAWFTTRKLAVFVGAYRQDYVAPANTGTTYPITIPDPPGTVYGGYIQVGADGSAELVVDRASVDPSLWTQYNQSNGYKAYRIKGLPYGKSLTDADNLPMSNMIGRFGSFSSDNMNRNIIQTPRPNSGIAYMALQDGLDATQVQLTYLIATPPHYPLSDIEVTTLRGQNNVWADCGPVNIKYWTH